MDPKHKAILISKRVQLVEELNMRDGLFTQLIARKLLNQRMVRTIQHNRTPDQQAEELLNILPTRGPQAFQQFCESLEADYQEDIVKLYLQSDLNDNSSHKETPPVQPYNACQTKCQEQYPSPPARISIHEDANHQFYIRCFNHAGHEKKSQSVCGEYTGYEENESRYMLKHFITDPNYPGFYPMSPREVPVIRKEHPVDSLSGYGSPSPQSPSSLNQMSQRDPSLSPLPERDSGAMVQRIPAEKPYGLTRTDSVDTMNKRPLMSYTSRPESPAKKTRAETKSITVVDPPEKLPAKASVLIEKPELPIKPLRGSVFPQFDDPEIDLTDGPVNVIVQQSNRQFYHSHFKKSYQMRRMPRGKALIINVNEVTGKSPRRGTDIDRDNLHNLLLQLHFDVQVYNDCDGLTAKEMAGKIVEFSNLKTHSEADCCVVCLLSHGEEGYIFGTDGGQISLDSVFSLFDNNNCPGLMGKPKIFIIQACRGGVLDKGVPVPRADETDGGKMTVTQMPTLSDMLICFPTQIGYYAWRNRDRGSWYIEALVHVFMKHAKDEDVCTMLNRVNCVVSKKVSRCPSLEMDQMSQMSEYKSTLCRPHLFFFPGIGCG